MRFALLLILATLVTAVEVPATVAHVTDGDTIAATLADGSEVKVRLLYVDTPESKGNSHGEARPEGKLAAAYLRELLPKGSRVTLWGPGAALELDRYQRALAVVVLAADDQGQPLVVQSAIIRMGWSPLWEKYGRADARWRPELDKAEQEAKAEGAGAWTTAPDYMTDKSNETTGPKAKE